ncbi:MAG TPA: hypothetical protein VGD87_09965 [Archangium sp.]
MRSLLSLVFLLAAVPATAETDSGSLYEVRTDGTTTKLKAGDTGKLVIAIKLKDGAHVSSEAPLKIELSSKQSSLAKEKLTLSDSTDKDTPRFEVPFTPTTQGPTSIEAKMTFFICTEKQCARQTKTLSLPVEVM